MRIMQQAAKSSDRKQIATSFMKLACSGRLEEAYDNQISPNFRHHNPYFRGDAESLKAGMAEAHQKFPNTTLDVQRVFESDDLVPVHSRVRHSPDTPEIAVVHIFRFEGDRIVEMSVICHQPPNNTPPDNRTSS